MLTRFDDYPIHQAAVPLAQAGNGHPDFYDRFWFNGYTQDMFFAVAMGSYPNRGVIDAAFSVVHDGVQRSVFASGRAPHDRTVTKIGPITVDIVEPMRTTKLTIDAPEQGLQAELDVRRPDGRLRGAAPDPLHGRPPAVRRHAGDAVRVVVGRDPRPAATRWRSTT